jgi:hypothetical protein
MDGDALSEPLALGGVVISSAAQSLLDKAWAAAPRRSLYSSAADFTELVQQV